MLGTQNIVTVIMTHYAANQARSELGRRSYESLLATTTLPHEIIIVDNGGDNLDDSDYFLGEVRKKNIAFYIRNAENKWFGYGRNQAASIAQGQYLFFTDNDMIFSPGWMEECIAVLANVKGKKYFVTPTSVVKTHRKHQGKPIMINGCQYQTNPFAGNNCWMMYAEDFIKIGNFRDHPLAGTHWCRKYCKMGYSVIVLSKQYAEHLGQRKTPFVGYNCSQH